jgi:hypothetical protein
VVLRKSVLPLAAVLSLAAGLVSADGSVWAQGRGRPGGPPAGQGAREPVSDCNNRRRPPTVELPSLITCTWWRDATVRQNLGLTDQQVRRIEDSYVDRFEDVRQAFVEMLKANAAVETMISGRQVTPDELSLKVLGVEALRSRAFEIRTLMYYGATTGRHLTAEQNEKLRAWWTARRAPGANLASADVFFPQSEWWKDPEVKRQVGLTDDLSARIEQSYQRRLQNAEPLIAEMRAKWAALDALIAARQLRPEALVAHILQAEALRSRVNESRSVMLYRFYREMTPEQYQKFDALMDARRRGRGAGSGSR